MDDGIDLTDIGEEFISQTLALGSALDQTRDVHELDDGRSDFVRLIHLGKLVQTMVRNSNGADVRLDGTEGIVCRLCTGIGNGIKQGALADVRQSHDS